MYDLVGDGARQKAWDGVEGWERKYSAILQAIIRNASS
jgi:hypothetical protein